MKSFEQYCIIIILIILVEQSLSANISEEFCYSDPECGPTSDKWPGICQTGTYQSPIDLKMTRRQQVRYSIMPLQHFKADHFFIQNNGETVKLDFTSYGNGGYIFPGYGLTTTQYKFSNAHFHWGKTDGVGSEHLVEGTSFSMEMHLVHYNAKYKTMTEAISSKDKNALAVVGIFLQATNTSKPNMALAPIIKALSKVQEVHSYWEKIDEPLDLSSLVPTSSRRSIVRLYNYKGSLTTPTCNEQVNWYVFEKPAFIAPSDVQAFRNVSDAHGKPLLENHRPDQKLNGRRIELFELF